VIVPQIAMRRPMALLLVLFLAAPTTYARRRAVSYPPAFAIPELEMIAAEALRDGVPGLTIAVRKGNAQLVQAWGNTRPDSVYQIASVTKQFTAAAIMRLVEGGKVRTEDKARKWLPELDARFDAITVEHLLLHRSGVREYDDQIPNEHEPKTHAQILAIITRGGPLFTPGTSFLYSNSGYYLLGMIVERASSQPYGQFLRETFFEPLGLRDTSYCGTVAPPPDGYVIDRQGTVFEVEALDMSIPFAAGALCSTADDLLRWTDALSSGRAVTPDSYARMIRNPGYGYALVINFLDGHRRIWHNGAILGFESNVTHFPQDGLTVVVLMDAIDLRTESRATQIAEEVARAAL
jgi:CubicO group peptidase (beta-lactamase class C family)